MKRMSFMVMALAMVLGFTQCKKDQPTNQNAENLVPITLTVAGGNGSKVIVNPTGHTDPDYATVTFEDDDVIYVGYNNKYVGTLTYSGGAFSGSVSIDEPVGSQPLHFYFLGGKGFTPSVVGDEATVVISDQTEKYPVISYAPSKEKYNGTGTYTAKLQNKMSIMKFNVTTPSTAAICITGMNNKVTVDFTDPGDADNGFSYDKDGEGIIKMAGGSGEPAVKWAIVLPQTALGEGTAGSAYSDDGGYTGTRPALAAIGANQYLNGGIAMSVNTPTIPVGAINGKFTINGSGDQVYFSRGNLQYQASTDTWRFAENQWNFVGGTYDGNTYGNVAGSSNDEISSTYSGWIDIFGWGTSGYNHGAVCYQPWSTSTTSGDYYAYGQDTYNLYDQTGQADWGYNAISNGGNRENYGWRTLAKEEWIYVVNTRSTSSGIRRVFAKVNDVGGLILLPDDWDVSAYDLNTDDNGYSDNIITATDWTDYLEANGAVFLPAGGLRDNGTSYNNDSAIPYGHYWSSSMEDGDSYDAHYCFFMDWIVVPANDKARFEGCSVRLVCE